MTDEREPEKLPQDPIVAEVRQTREALFADAGYDIHEFCRRLSEKQGSSGHPVVRSGNLPTAGEAA